jgi:cytochrome o ubiquinol oxidase subunit 2
MAARAGVLIAPCLLCACSDMWLLAPRGPVGATERTLLIDSLAIMLAIVVPTIVATFAFAWWFRARNAKAHYRPDWAFSGAIEIVVWAIPLLTIVLLSGVAWIGSHQLDPARPLPSKTEPLRIQVVSLDWKWLFIYPAQRVASVNELVVPAGVPLRFALTSGSVFNTFFVPQLGSMIYTMNGMTTQLNLQVDAPGTMHGMSAHFSGDGFADMHFPVRAVTGGEFDAWVHTARGGDRTLDEAAYRTLARQSSPAPRATFASIDPELFHRIAMRHVPPGPGPAVDRDGASEQPAPTTAGKP